jgi:hypothetical protein
MTIKSLEGASAYRSLITLNQHKFTDGRIAIKIFNLMNKLKPVFDFRLQEEKKIIDAHPNFDPTINGIKIEEDGSNKEEADREAKEIQKEFEDLGEIESEIDYEPFDLDLSKEQIPLSADDIKNLTKFINFIS